MPQRIHSLKLYLGVYVALLALLIATVAISFVDIGRWSNNSVAMGIGCAKAVLIVLFFMHIKYEPRIAWAFAAAGFIWLGIMLTLTMSDYFTRNHPPGMSSKGEPVFLLTDEPGGGASQSD